MWFRFGRSYPDFNFIFCNPSRMSIDRMRNMTAKVALEQEADYVLFIDDDVLVPLDGLAKLLAAGTDVAGGKAVIRGYPFDWMVFTKIEDDENGYPKGGSLQVYKDLPKEGVIEIGAIGFCFTLIKVDVFRNMQAPYFVTGLNHTEDIYFCIKAREANPNFKVVVDCSVDCGHILWPEIMNSQNRELYKEYFEKYNEASNPGWLKGVRSIHEPMKKHGDRAEEYLSSVEAAIDEIDLTLEVKVAP